MPLSFSADSVKDRLARGPAFPYDITTRLSLWSSVLVVGALFGWGAWQRRWIADDGLIVFDNSGRKRGSICVRNRASPTRI